MRANRGGTGRRRLKAARARSYSSRAERHRWQPVQTWTSPQWTGVRGVGDRFRISVRSYRNNIAPLVLDAYILTMQLPLFGRQMQAELARTEHGGDRGRGRRKLERPVSTRRPMHVVLTSHRARGPWSLRKHDRAVRDILRSMARQFDIRIYDFANVGSHLHIVLRARRRDAFQGFLRSFAGIVARRITGARRAHPSVTQAGPSSPAWHGRVSSSGVATTWACATMSFATKSKGPRA